MKKINTAIIGQGHSGRDIHAAYFSGGQELFNVVAVADRIEKRRQGAAERFSCPGYGDYRDFFRHEDIELVINCAFSDEHYPITMDLLEHGYHVVVEKPFSGLESECVDMARTARERRVMLSVFQQSRFAPYYKKIKEIIKSGALGRLIQIDIRFSGFTRRWDWQTLQRRRGGSLYNTGPHPFDQALDLLGPGQTPAVFSRLDRVNTSGDADDYVKAILTVPGRPLIDIEISTCDGYPSCTYKIHAERGSLLATPSKVKWKYFIPENEPARPLIEEPLEKADGSPSYCTENLEWHEFEEELTGSAFDAAVAEYYQNIHDCIRHGAPLIVRPEEIIRQIRIIEEIHRQNPLQRIY